MYTYKEEGMVKTELVDSSTVDTGLQYLSGFNDALVYEMEGMFIQLRLHYDGPHLKPEPRGRCPQSGPGLPGERGRWI